MNVRATAVLAVLAGVAACADARDPRVSDDLAFPASGDEKSDVAGRKLLGIAQPYVADSTLAAREGELASNVATRRAAAWDIARRVLEPVPLLGLQDDSNVTLPPGVEAIPTVPRFQTWYGVEDIKRMFVELLTRLGADGRARRDPIPADGLDAIEAWNAAAADRSSRWPLERYLQYVEDLGTCPEGAEPDACARLLQSQFSGAASGNARITYSPATVRHVLANYASIVACLEALTTLSIDAVPASDRNFSVCLENEFPSDAVLIKAHWVRADFGKKLATFDTDAAALARIVAASQTGDWAAGDRESDPDSESIYTIKLRSGDTYRLAGLHIMTKELRHWTWVTLWWSDTPDVDFGEDRPRAFLDAVAPLWGNYKLCAVTGYDERDAAMATHLADSPTLAAAMAAVSDGAAGGPSGGGPTWCSNPYIEHGRGNARTNCIGCHQHGGSLVGPDLDADGKLDPFPLERVIDSEALFPLNGRAQIRQVFPTDYLWSTVRIDDLAHLLRSEVTRFADADARDPEVRAPRVVALSGDRTAGAALFSANCTPCHGEDGRGTERAPSLYDRVPPLSNLEVAATLIQGKGYMPVWGNRFEDQQLADLVAFLRATFDAAATP